MLFADLNKYLDRIDLSEKKKIVQQIEYFSGKALDKKLVLITQMKDPPTLFMYEFFFMKYVQWVVKETKSEKPNKVKCCVDLRP